MRSWICTLLAALVCAGAARAQDRRTEPPPPQQQRQPSPPPPQQQKEPAPLSQEDAELVKQLALLEQMDLVKNLELFQPDKEDEKAPPQLQP
jgi:hypothetical protein